MPTPVSTPNSSFYDPNAQFTPADQSGRTSAAASITPSAAAEVTIDPVVINGDAGARELLRRLDAASSEPDCSLEAKTAALSCAKAGATAAGGLLISTTGVGLAVGVAATLAEGISCGKDLRAYNHCKTQ
jgi:hypothetical protein